jgi:LmbE family N-acetylglucosaminyl deacetylase
VFTPSSYRRQIARSEGVLANGTVLAGLAPVDCSKGRVLSFIAHIDDDLLFMNPSIWRAITGGKCVRTVTTTAGDAGLGQEHSSYWKGREAGHRAAYADMIGVANSSWTFGDAGVAGRSILMATSTANPKVSLVWMRLPDGGVKGGGFKTTGLVSLQRLWNGNATSLSALDGSATYTRDELQGTLREIMSNFEPTEIKTLNYVNETGDHPDHFVTAWFVQAAAVRTPSGDLSARLASYIGYPIDQLPANVNGTELTAKECAWYTYAPFDEHMCKTPKSCAANFIGPWLSREYTVTN